LALRRESWALSLPKWLSKERKWDGEASKIGRKLKRAKRFSVKKTEEKIPHWLNKKGSDAGGRGQRREDLGLIWMLAGGRRKDFLCSAAKGGRGRTESLMNLPGKGRRVRMFVYTWDKYVHSIKLLQIKMKSIGGGRDQTIA